MAVASPSTMSFVLCLLTAPVGGLGQPISSRVLAPFHQQHAVKIISGLMNFDVDHVVKVCRAAEAGGASLVDIACDPGLVAAVKDVADIPICVSSVDPQKFAAAVKAGATMVEIGNYDFFYEHGRTFSAAEVLALTEETLALDLGVPVSVTVPHTLPLDEQVALAEAIVARGVDVIQTEGSTISRPEAPGVLGMIEKASPSLAATYEISNALQGKAHVMAASGITDVTAPMALAVGASGVGVGSLVNKLKEEVDMSFAVRRVVSAVAAKGVSIPAATRSPP